MGRYLAAAILAICALAWLAVAAVFATEAGPWTFDGDCYQPRPAWAIGQAAIAVAGAGFLVRAFFAPRREVLALAGIALFVVWLVLILAFATDVEIVLCPGQSPEYVH